MLAQSATHTTVKGGVVVKKVSVTLFAAVLTAALLLPLYALSAVADTTVSARHAALYEPVTDTFLYEKNGDDRAPMASTTKVMTALVVLEQANLDETVSIPPEACGIEGSSIYMKPGERMTVRDLLYALLLQSANDAAAALAITVSGSIEAFARQMNERASALGLVNTHFVNPHGLDDPEHFTSAKDLARIAAASMEIPEFRDMVGTVKYTIPIGNDGSTRVLFNHNRLLRLYGDAVGIKTGFTKKSGRCLVGAACRDGMTLISVTLDAPNDWNDHIRLFDYGFSRMENRLLCPVRAFTYELPLIDGTGSQICVNAEKARGILPKDAEMPELRINLPHFLVTHQKPGAVVGSIQYYYKGKMISDVPLIIDTSSSVKE